MTAGNDPQRPPPLDKAQVEAFVADWYRLLDAHAPADELVARVAELGLEMQLPEGTLSGVEAFRQWYEGVIRLFFDEAHTLKTVEVTLQPDGGAAADIVVNWQARRWWPPARNSQWIGFDAYQHWVLAHSPATGRPVITRYIVDRMEPMPGSPPLSPPIEKAEAERFVVEWFQLLDIHAPTDRMIPQVAAQGLEMQFPEGPVHGVDAFRRWYEGVVRIFFDEIHTVRRAEVTLRPDGSAAVDVLVNWQARRWRAPARNSEWLGFDVTQQWVLVRSPITGGPVIQRYAVNRLDPMEGSVPL